TANGTPSFVCRVDTQSLWAREPVFMKQVVVKAISLLLFASALTKIKWHIVGFRSLERFMEPESLKCLVGPVDVTTRCMTSRTEVQHA
ncbi:MAG: hypothetical protein WCB79_01485, partial [Halobacteriota archaeon]